MICVFLDLKTKSLAKNTPRNGFWAILVDFGKIDFFGPKFSGGGGGGGYAFFGHTQIFGDNFFSNTCNFFKKWNFGKKKFGGPVWILK